MDLFPSSTGGPSKRTSGGEEDSNHNGASEGAELTINKEYAARFNHNKERAELHRLQEKHGNRGDDDDDDDDESSSDDETEDDEGEQVTADVDAAILTTLAKIRRKDESIYEAGKRVFDEERSLASQSKLLPRKMASGDGNKRKVTLAEYQRTRIQELMKTSDDPARALADATMIQRRDNDTFNSKTDESEPLPFTREQEELRREVTNAFHTSAGDGEEDFFTRKEGDNYGDADDDPESYKKFLLGVLGGKDKEDAVREILRAQTEEAAAGDAPKPARGKAPKVRVEDGTEQENEDFLMNYVLNRGWLENPSEAPRNKVKKERKEKIDDIEVEQGNDGFSDLDSEDSYDSRAEAYENAYNFRFEELEGGEAESQIQSYARNPIGSVRRTEDKRKKEREERAKRKQEEKEEKKREIDRMKDLKRKSIVDRLKKLKEATGSTNVDFERFQLDAEFDPEEHDRLMQVAFNDDYYGEDEDGKPKWDDDLDMGSIVDEDEEGRQAKKGSKAKKKSKSKKDDIEMDADYMGEQVPVEEVEEVGGKKLSKAEKKKLKKREKAKAKKHEGQGDIDVGEEEMNAEVEADADEIMADRLNPAEQKQKMEEAMNEYYGLDYEDMIGDQPTRFKYTPVAKSTYGLTPEEILLADDDDLKGIVSLNRIQPYRENQKRPSDLNTRVKEFRRKFYQDRERKAKQEESKEGEGEEAEEKSKTKRMGKKERQRRKEAGEKAAAAEAAKAGTSTSVVESEERPKKKSRSS
ncbi:hypothetical protein CBS101457_005671 [Exobasidium rhododendri]|nr:hypothetical protein CBS101457_005671 [Exobasidium rhododendri]